MTAEQLPRWQLTFPARHVIIAELVALPVVLAVAQQAWWVALIAVFPVFLAVGVRYRGATTPRWMRRAAHKPTATPIPSAVEVELPGVGPIGMRFDGPYALTVIALHGRTFPTTLLVPAGTDTTDTVPLDAVAGLLHQFGDLELHSVDVVSAGARAAADGRYTPRYDEIIGDRPAVGTRRTWLILRLCPQACLKALAYRGDVGTAVAAATERIRQAAVTAGCRASTCGPDQLDTLTADLLGGHQLTQMQEQWSHLRVGNDYVTSYRMAGTDLSSRLLSDLWTIRSRMTVTVLRLTPHPGRDTADVAGLVRLHTSAPLTHPPLSTLHSLAGQQRSALHASLPLGKRAITLPLARRPLTPSGRRGALLVPVGPCGPMLGMSRAGVPLLMPFTDPLKFVKIAIAADFDVAAALLLRATAAGADAVVHTDRPHVWEPICDERLILAGRVHAVNTPPTLLVADGDTEIRRLEASSGERGHALVITGPPSAPKDFDVVIIQEDRSSLDVRIRDGRRFTLAVMRPRNEMQFLQAGAVR